MMSAMINLKIADLRPKQDIESVYLLKYINLVEARDGKKYLNIILSDNTGDLESRVWNSAEKVFEQFEKGQFVKVQGKVNLYQGRKQFVIQHIEPVDTKEINTDDYISKSDQDAEKMYVQLLQVVKNLDDVYIRELLHNIISDTEIARRLKKWQAGKTIHHAYQGGLLEHILSCADLAVMLSKFYKVNKNYVVCGAILHDLCKIYELTDDFNVEYTEEGKLVGHLVKGVELVDRFAYKIDGFPYNLKLHIKHILLSHHGEYEYGSPKIPQTIEAMLVHLIDMMDSKMNSFRTVQKTDQNQGHWSGFIKHLDRIVYKDELPFYPEKVSSPKRSNQSKKTSNELKQNLGDVLKDIKL